jgi:hypothetical protein
MFVLLLMFYYITCAYGVGKMDFIRKSGIRPLFLQCLFVLHVAVGCLHNAIAWRFYPEHGDIWQYFQFSAIESRRLVSDFHLFWYYNSHWDFFSHNAITYIHIILNLFSFQDLYINTLLFSFPVFLGNIALFRVFRRRFPDDPLTAFCVFLLPSVLFWTSCVHREGVLYMLLGFLLFNFDRLLTRGFNWKQTCYCLLCFLLIFCFRSAFALSLLPALYLWILAAKRQARRKLLLAGFITTGLLILLILPVFDLPEAIARRQQEFFSLEGHSRLHLPALDGSWSSLLRVLPAAIRNGGFEPLPGSGGQPIYWAFSLELLAIWAIAFLAILRIIRNRRKPTLLAKEPLLSPFGLFSLLFALTGMLIIGIMVPFAGAIVRYRSIYLPFLLAPFLHSLRVLPLIQRINEWLSKHISHRL